VTLYNGDTPYQWSSIGNDYYGWEMYGQTNTIATLAFDNDDTTGWGWSHDRYYKSYGLVDGVYAIEYSNEYAYANLKEPLPCTKIRFHANVDSGGFLLVLNKSRLIYVYASNNTINNRIGVEGVDYIELTGTGTHEFFINLVPLYFVFDGLNKLTIENPPANATTTLKFTPTGSTDTQSIEIGTATEFTIVETGTYSVIVKSASSYFMSNDIVVVEIKSKKIYSRFEEVDYSLTATSPGTRFGISPLQDSNWTMHYSDGSPVIYTYTIDKEDYIISTDGFGYNQYHYNVFKNDNSYWYNRDVAITTSVDNNYIMIEYPVITPINKYLILCGNVKSYSPTGWKIYGVTSDGTHNEIDSQSFDANSFYNTEVTFNLSQTVEYKKYKIKITSRNGGQYNWINLTKFLPMLDELL